MNRKPGDWDCASCDHLNFSWRDSCQRCSEPKPREGHGGKIDERHGYGRGAAFQGFESGFGGGRGSASSEFLYGRNNGTGGDYRGSYGGDYRVGYGGDPRSGYVADPRGGYGGDLRSSYGSDPRSGYGGDYRGGYEMDYRSGYGGDYRSGYAGDYRNGYGGDYNRGNYGGGDYMSRSYGGDEYSGRSFGASDYNSRSYGGSAGYGGMDTRPGDWPCKESSCGAHNFASRTSCYKCGVAKDERGGKGKGDTGRGSGYELGGRGTRGSFGTAQDSANAGDGDRPGWRSGDWMCTRSGCNEHNFAIRLQCFRCQAPRET